MDDERVTVAFMAIAELGCAMKIRLDQLPGTWRHQVDELWHIELNGHQQDLPDVDGLPLKPYHCHIKFNGWPAGILNPRGGCIAAGEAANEETFIAALNKATSDLPDSTQGQVAQSQ